MPATITPEEQRLAKANERREAWRKWGPYVSERQWGTVREDYSADGDAWNYFPHDHARSRAYRWGEDGIGGFCDAKQQLCMAVALWNGRDPILKERMFGLSNREGNHGEDVKELYYYLDAVPTYSYARMLYKYPQAAFPYDLLVQENALRDRRQPEFEIIDTGIFDTDRYFDVDIEYAKAGVDDILLRVTVTNRGPEEAAIHVLPQVWFRNTWSWFTDRPKPSLERTGDDVVVKHETLGAYSIHFDGPDEIKFCENETNVTKLYGCEPTGRLYKDGFNDYLVGGAKDAVGSHKGTKAAGIFRRTVAAGASTTIRVRLSVGSPGPEPFDDFERIFSLRKSEADAFYAGLQSKVVDEDLRRIQRQAFAGVLWSKQYFYYDVTEWLDGDPAQPPPAGARHRGRNSEWVHATMEDVVSMPDKWEFPWFAAWDWAFHLVTLALLDLEDAKHQLILLGQSWYMHPNGQLPAYEWNFSDVNPPVQAWAALRLYEEERRRNGQGDRKFLERIFTKLLLNFTWWVNRKDPRGLNVFEGGFLGMDNIGVFDRSAPLPVDGMQVQSDGTSWMAMYSLNMLRIAIELAQEDDAYQDIATKFFEHFLMIGGAMTNLGGKGLSLWDDTDNFFYDWLVMGNGEATPLRVRSLVGLIPAFAVETIDEAQLKNMPSFTRQRDWYLRYRPKLAALVSRVNTPGADDTRQLAIARAFRASKVMARVLDKNEFLSDYGIRSLSRYHLDHPYVFEAGSFRSSAVRYVPAESDSDLFGGNSNWRGPIWMPINYLFIESVNKFAKFYGNEFRVECPVGSGAMLSLKEIADDLRNRLINIFRRDDKGRRAVFGGYEKMQTDPHFKDYLLFHEYYDGDTGRGLGASHQTGWSALVANMIAELHE
ncbi:MGH1-like glycoside hydrolase domain-containing protein [Reyranella soli]|uniref:Glucosidase n=1 Tax=Reyranella soli TaxID=1230389 RepID=A0A512NCC6_9HYPH|nr:glucosidase [Reyranella soli]GEP56585.1 glucosidase [Reyranella soli]